MKTGVESQFESLIGQRFKERDRHFSARLLAVKQEHNRRGLLTSSSTVEAMHAELEREFEESATECVKALAEVMESRPTALPVPPKRKVVRLCSDALSERRVALDATHQGASANIAASLLSDSMITPHRSLSDSFVQLQCENAFVELRAKQRELFWSKLKRMKLGAALVAAVVGGMVSYLGGAEIAEVWQSLRATIEQPAGVVRESTEKTAPGMEDA